ncbi:nucleotidyltransferase family protein [Roseovarius sp. CAU 1744]|uniref:nucleotidyltransferase family protein n=1 Tax=Roseovarius sp. CAU 1744 TaxID=3140368 RepID=UPI00325B37FB
MRDRPGSVMLFAAGFGTRMGALTADRPKPLIPVAGKALIDHALDLVNAYGPDRIVANLHYLPDQVEAHLADRGVAFSREEPEILETGGGLRAALPLLGHKPVFTMNTDAIWRGPNPLTFLAERWDAAKMDALLLCLGKQQALGHTGAGDFIADAEGRAIRGPGVIYSGLQIIRTETLASFQERKFSLNRVWDIMLDHGRLFTATYPGMWCDVGQPQSISLAERLLAGSDV